MTVRDIIGEMYINKLSEDEDINIVCRKENAKWGSIDDIDLENAVSYRVDYNGIQIIIDIDKDIELINEWKKGII